MSDSASGSNPRLSSQTSPPPYSEAPSQALKPAAGPSVEGYDYAPIQHPAIGTQSGLPGTVPQPQYSPEVFAHHQQQHHHPLFGPTPLSSQPVVPYAYYDPHSPHSLALADSRARWRFLGAMIWAVGIWMLIGLFIGIEVEVASGGRRFGGTGTWAQS